MASYFVFDHPTCMYINPARAWNGNPGALQQHRYWLDAEPFYYDDLTEALDAKFTMLAENGDNNTESIVIDTREDFLSPAIKCLIVTAAIWAIAVFLIIEFA